MENNKDFKILVVDDSPEILDITILALKKEKYTVFSATTGAECMDVLKEVKPHLLLLDVMLPDANGIDLAKIIKNDTDLSDVFIILLSGLKTSADFVSEGIEGGADGYIVRPVEKRELLARVTSACRIIKAEKESKSTLAKYESLFLSMEEGVYLHEMIYDETGKAIDYRIIEANPASEKHLHMKVDEVLGQLASELFKAKEAPLLEIYAKVAQEGNPISFEQYFQPMGKYFQISAFSPVKGTFATAFSDITERKEAEEKIHLKNTELQKLNDEKDKFFSIIAHDLKSPFNSIIGFSDLLVEQVNEKDYKGIEEYAQIIQQSSIRAMGLLMNLMEWSKMQTGRMEFNPMFFELDELIKDTELLLSGAIEQKSITISKNLLSNETVFADKKMIATVLRNLISNAIKFTYPGGEITISVEEKQNELLVSVSDTGVGISKERIDKLFSINESYSTTGTKNEKGTGLGLILCKDFVEKHGGKIWVESEEGNGSTFYFTKPYIKEPKEKTGIENVVLTDEKVKPKKPNLSGLKILIVEDDLVSALLIKKIVGVFSTELFIVDNGIEAIESCRNNPDIDLVLMDIKMSGMTGYEATQQIREFNKKVVIIAQTAFAAAGDREKAIKAGCDDYITKPINKNELLALIVKYF